MKNLIIAAFAAVAVSTVAYAADLPRKDIAPALPAAPVATQLQHVVSSGVTTNFEAGEYGDISSLEYTLGYHYLGIGNGVSVGGNIIASSSTDISDIEAKRVEADILWSQPVGFGITTNIGGGLGYRLSEEEPYFKLNSGFDYALNDVVTLNAVSYQFRDTFENNWQSHEVGTGVTVKVVDNVSVSGRIARSFDEDLNSDEDKITVGANFSF